VQNIAKKLCDDSIEQGTLEAIDDEKQRAILELFAKALQLEENLPNRAANSTPTIGNVDLTQPWFTSDNSSNQSFKDLLKSLTRILPILL